jgi:hypothetical protein
MKKLIGILGIVMLFNVAGCATKESVQAELDPMGRPHH